MFPAIYWIVSVQSGINESATNATNQTLINREAGYKSRAIQCQVLISLGENAVPDTCKEPDVLKHYDPTKGPTAGSNSPGQTKNRALLCAILKEHNKLPDNCMDPNAPVPGFS